MVLPLVLRYLCPRWVGIVGLGAVSAAVMSSADSSILSASSMFARNVIKPIFWKSATERQVIYTMRGLILVVGAAATLMAIYIETIYGLWFLCSDLVYVILFPQLICVLYQPTSNTYGSLAAYVVGLVLRLGSGEVLLSLPALIRFPYYTEDKDGFTQLFPVKTFAMLMSLATCAAVSHIAHILFTTERLSKRWDYFECYLDGTSKSYKRKRSLRMCSLRRLADGRERELSHEDEAKTKLNAPENEEIADEVTGEIPKVKKDNVRLRPLDRLGQSFELSLEPDN